MKQGWSVFGPITKQWALTGTDPVEQESTTVLPMRPHSAECSLWELASGPPIYFRGCVRGRGTVWASLHTYTCHWSQVWRQVPPAA